MLRRHVTVLLAAMFALVLVSAPLARAQIGSDDVTETGGFVDATSDDASTAQDGGGAANADLVADCNDPALTDEEFDACLAGEGPGSTLDGEDSSAPHGGIAFSIGGFAPPPQQAPPAPAPTSPTCATRTLFSDGFEGDAGPALAVTALVNWNVQAGGNVDVVNPFPGANGHAIDLDGSTNVLPGDGTPVITLKVPVPVVAGRTYTVFYRIGTNPVVPADVNNLNVTFGPAAASNSKDPLSFGTETIEALTFVAATSGTAQLTFNDPDPDDRGGVILDEVTVTESCPT